MEASNPVLEKAMELDISGDSVVILVDSDGTFGNVPYADRRKLVVQVLSPLVERFGLEAAFTAARRNNYWHDRLALRGVRKDSVSGSIDWWVVPNSLCCISSRMPALISPYIPGPRLDQICSNLELPSYQQISPEEQRYLDRTTRDQCMMAELEHNLWEVGMKLRQQTGIVHLDPVNAKLRYDIGRGKYVFIITDIENQIGRGLW